MRHRTVALLGLCLLGHAYADATQENLIGIQISDLCPLGIYVYEDGKLNQQETQRLKKILDDQISLFGFEFPKTYPSTCTIGGYFSFQSAKLKTDAHVYANSFIFFAFNSTTKTSKAALPAKAVGLYDISTFGYQPTYQTLIETREEDLKDFFQRFGIDWRKTH